jgi:catechol 2,3-dioxygenase-like lactoylglutathione lyase family enzyme
VVSATGPGAFSHATVGVADLDQALALWLDTFGFELRGRREGADPGLAALWGLEPGRIARQALVYTPGAQVGGLHLVEFRDPLPPVREGARPFDLLPKNLDLYTVDLPARQRELAAAGHEFRSDWVEVPGPDDLRFREVHMAGHDGLNIVLLEVLGPGYATPLSPRGFAGIGPLVAICPDLAAEAVFWREQLGLETTLEFLLAGPQVERMVGLPPGAGLDLRVYGDPAEPLGRIELIEYQRARGEDRYPRALPPATGLLHATWRVPDLAPLRQRLAAAGVAVTGQGELSALFGSGPVLACRSPAGFRVELQGLRD